MSYEKAKRLSQITDKVVSETIADLTDRKGLRQEWEQIDYDIQAEIKHTWGSIIFKALNSLEA